MTRASVRTAAVLLAVLSASGCSFQGSINGSAGDSSSFRTSASAGATSAGHPTGSGNAPSSTTPSTPTTPTPTTAPAGSTSGTTGGPPAGPDRCHTADLTASLVPGSSGAGQRYATLVLTDSGSSPCTLHGYGGLGLAGPGGAPLPTRQVRVSDPAPTTVTLRPGGSVRAQLHWGAVAGAGDAQSGNCQPVPSTLQVIPPDETAALSVTWDQGPVCEGGTIEQKAYAG